MRCFSGEVNSTWLGHYRGWLLLASATVPIVAAALLALVRDGISSGTAVLVLVLLVVAASATGVRAAGILAAVGGGVGFDWFLTEPYGTFTVTRPDDIETLVLLLVVGVAVTELALWGLRQQAAASRHSGYLDGVLATAETVAAQSPAPQDLVRIVNDKIVDVLGLDACRYEPNAQASAVVIEPDGSLTRRGRPVDVDREGLPVHDEVSLAVRSAGHSYGAFVLVSATHVARPSREQRRVAVLLADQVAGVLARPQ